MAGRVCIVDDDAGFTRAIARGLRRSGLDVTSYHSATEARRQLLEADPDVVVLDYQLPDADGLALLDELRPSAGGAVFIMATAYPDLDVAVEAMRRGAFDYVAKGSELKETLMRIGRGAEVALLRRRMAEAARPSAGESDYGLLGESGPMQALRARLGALDDDTTVLITGETGTGKGVMARAIHADSARAYEPLVSVDCTTIPATLVESELFGHEKGAFSGATATKMGRVEAAGQGTLFLDEIGELELPVQAKLLRLLEEREFTRVGGTRTRKVQARIITATNRDLERAVAEGRFRADLRYRLEVFVVHMPALRDRGDDIFLLTAHFVAERARALGRDEPRLHPKVIEWLPRYPFPGNIRELRNMVDQAVLLAKDHELTLDEFPVLSRMAAGWRPPAPGEPTAPQTGAWTSASAGAVGSVAPSAQLDTAVPGGGPRNRSAPPIARGGPSTDPPLEAPAAGASPGNALAAASAEGEGTAPVENLQSIRRRAAERERRSLVATLEATEGNVSAAARQLGLSRYQMLRRLKKHGLR